MSEFKQVTTKKELALLDGDEILKGYRDCYFNKGETLNSTKSRSYHHGWNNALTDKGIKPVNQGMRALASDMHEEIEALLIMLNEQPERLN